MNGSMGLSRTDDRGGASMSRRRFVRLVVGFSITSTIALVAAPIVGFLSPRPSTKVGTGGRLRAGTTAEIGIGRSKVVALGASPVIVVNSPKNGVKAFSAVCTHLGCIVGYDESLSPDIVSPCHNGHFSTFDGKVLSGPPPRPLAQYGVAVEGSEIFVVG